MKAGLRSNFVCLAALLMLAPAPALAQQQVGPTTTTTPTTTTDASTTNTPATDAVGPRDLQNFSLSGRVTRPADRPAATTPPATTAPRDVAGTSAKTPPAPKASTTSPAPTRSASSDQPRPAVAAPPNESRAAPTPPEPLAQSAPSSSVAVALPQLGNSSGAAPVASPGFAPAPEPANLAPERSMGLIPWLLAAIALGAGAAFLFWRSRSREAFAGGPQVNGFTAPEPGPRPIPRPAPPAFRAPPPEPPSAASLGIVSTRLRPWIEIGFQPLRCLVEGDQVTIEFEVELFNSGSAPARAVLAEASLFNAGPAQEQEIGGFFANPVGAGERIVEIAPLKRVALASRVVAPLTQIQRYQMAGKEVFVPVIAFNLLYRWGNGEGQTSVSYLLGRGTESDKLGPFRLDLGPRVFRGLAARLLPAGVRQ